MDSWDNDPSYDFDDELNLDDALLELELRESWSVNA